MSDQDEDKFIEELVLLLKKYGACKTMATSEMATALYLSGCLDELEAVIYAHDIENGTRDYGN